MSKTNSIQRMSVIVPQNPFVREEMRKASHCLTALDVVNLMEWWPGKPHTPHRDARKVRAIQRSLDWKRVVQIAAYLLQREILDAPAIVDKHFRQIYEPKKNDPGREWPPRLSKVIGFEQSVFPTFSNVLLHVNGAKITPSAADSSTAELIFDAESKDLRFSVIDGQHRINGAYLAVQILRDVNPGAKWEIPAEIFLDLDAAEAPPRHQAQIFIDVNFYQKKVDRSLVTDLFPTARGRNAIGDAERAQDLGRKLMLDIGPLVGMVQIPGIKFGVKDVVTLATLCSAIEDVLPAMKAAQITSLEIQAEFLAQFIESWLDATGWKEDQGEGKLQPENVAYQGRVIVSFLTLLPAGLTKLGYPKDIHPVISRPIARALTDWLRGVLKYAGLMENGRFLEKGTFKSKGYLGSGGLGRLRDTLWAAAFATKDISKLSPERIAALAVEHRGKTQGVFENAAEED